MTNDSWDDTLETESGDKELLEAIIELTPSVGAGHDAAILAAARSTSDEIQSRGRPGWSMPLAMAASFILGIGLLWTAGPSLGLLDRGAPTDLVIPDSPTRGAMDGPLGDIPVEKADPQIWYEYIQELVYNGEFELAEQHLRRFNELHPDYRPDAP